MIASFSDEQLAHLQQIAGNLPVEKRAAFIEKPAEIKGLRFHNAQCNVWLYRNLKLRPYPPGRPCPDRLTSRRSTRCSTASTCRDDTRRASAEQRRSWRRRPAHEDKPRNRTEYVSCVSPDMNPVFPEPRGALLIAMRILRRPSAETRP
jgi:hypothetical protein